MGWWRPPSSLTLMRFGHYVPEISGNDPWRMFGQNLILIVVLAPNFLSSKNVTNSEKCSLSP